VLRTATPLRHPDPCAMAALPVCVMQGDFLDGVVESALRTMADQLKAEYRKELSRALEAADLEAASGAGASRTDAPQVTVPPPTLNTPLAEVGEGQLDLVGELRTTASVPGPPAREHGSTVRRVRMSRLAPEHAVAWRQSCTSNGINNNNNNGRGTQLSTAWELAWEAEAPFGSRNTVRHNDRWQGRLAEVDTDAIKSMREEEIAREEALLARLGQSTSMPSVPAAGEASRCRIFLYRAITSPRFDFGMGFVIILNALTIGTETSLARRGGHIPTSLRVAEYTFVIIYCVELAMRLYVLGKQKAFSNHWVKFDALMVAAGLLNLLFTLTAFGGDPAAAVVDSANMLKMIRLFRLAKTVRVVVQFRTLWMLVQGLMYAVMPMFWTAILMIVVIYVFAVIAMETIQVSGGNSDYSTAAHHYDTIGGAMLTLMQLLTLDSVAAIYRPLITTKPWLVIYFVIFILLGPIALMNIVTAIMVESSLRTASEDQEAKKAWKSVRRKILMPKLRSIFFALDTSGDGEVDREELLNAPPDIKEAIQHIVGLDELEEVFSLMDYDGSGVIDIGEFVDGIMRSQADKPSELFVLVKQSKAILEMLQGLGPRPPARTSACEGAPCNAWDCESLAT